MMPDELLAILIIIILVVGAILLDIAIEDE